MLQKYYGVFIIILIFHTAYGQSDSAEAVSVVGTRIDAFLATSFMLNKNWKESNNSSILLSASVKINSSESKSDKRISEIQAELSYLKFIDSIWIKNNDRFYASNIWILDQRKIRQTFSINFTTQLTDSWIEKSNGVKIERKWKSGPLLPAAIVWSYGFIYKPSIRNYFNFSFPALKTGSMPIPAKVPENLKIIDRNESYLLYNEYGINILINIEKKIGSKIFFESNTTLFITKTVTKNYFLDMRNMISYIPVKNLKIRIENKIQYDKKVSDLFQWKYDVLFGLSVSF